MHGEQTARRRAVDAAQSQRREPTEAQIDAVKRQMTSMWAEDVCCGDAEVELDAIRDMLRAALNA